MSTNKRLVRNSSVYRTINVIGEYWTLLIIRDAFFGACRYSDFKESLDITHATLTSRLKRMVATGLLTKADNGSCNAPKAYRLTEMGRDLYCLILLICQWEERWLRPGGDSDTPPLLTHHGCGKRARPILICEHCREAVHTRDVDSEDGPGAGEEKAAPQRMQRQASIPQSDASQGTKLLSASAPIVGDRWAAMILASTFKGLGRFDEYLKQLKISPDTLSQRLSMLLNLEMLEQRLYQQAPDRYEYLLTEKAIDFYPVIVAMMTWGDKWLADEKGPPIILHHRPCGKHLKPVLVCSACDNELVQDEFSLNP